MEVRLEGFAMITEPVVIGTVGDTYGAWTKAQLEVLAADAAKGLALLREAEGTTPSADGLAAGVPPQVPGGFPTTAAVADFIAEWMPTVPEGQQARRPDFISWIAKAHPEDELARAVGLKVAYEWSDEDFNEVGAGVEAELHPERHAGEHDDLPRMDEVDWDILTEGFECDMRTDEGYDVLPLDRPTVYNSELTAHNKFAMQSVLRRGITC